MTNPGTSDVVFLIDVDNTLLDNDAVIGDLHEHIGQALGSVANARYWELFEELRGELGYADYLGALQRYRNEHPRDVGMLQLSMYLVDYPFAERLYPRALDVVRRLQGFGKTVILSDGDVVFQPRKVQQSGIWQAVDGQVLIYIHKEQMLADVEARYPARHYVMVDDKLHILAAMKAIWGDKLTTVFPKQGHYAHDQSILSVTPAADIEVDGIGDLMTFDVGRLTNR